MLEYDADSRQRQRAFVVVVRSRVLRIRLAHAMRQTSWLRLRSRYLTKRLNQEWHGPF